MNSMMDKANIKLQSFAEKFGQNIYVQSIANGVMGTLPLTIAGSIFLVVANLPFTSYTEWLYKVGIAGALNSVAGATNNLIGLLCVFLIAYNFAKKKNLDALTGGLLSLASFIILMPQSVAIGNETVTALEYSYLGSGGVFVAIIVALLTVTMYGYIDKRGWKIKMPDSVPEMVERSFSPIIAAGIIFFIYAVVSFIFMKLSFGNVYTFIQTIIQKPIISVTASPLAFILIWTFISLVWWCGIHPAAITGLMTPVMSVIALENLNAYQAGNVLPNMTVDFQNLMTIGGTGGTLGLCVVLAFFSKSERCKKLGKIAIVPSIFNINEPIIFGLPVVMNPYMFVPIVLNPIVTGIIAWVGLNSGLVNYSKGLTLPWTMPSFGIFFINGGISLLLLSIICALASTLLYYPFVKSLDKSYLIEEKSNS